MPREHADFTACRDCGRNSNGEQLCTDCEQEIEEQERLHVELEEPEVEEKEVEELEEDEYEAPIDGQDDNAD